MDYVVVVVVCLIHHQLVAVVAVAEGTAMAVKLNVAIVMTIQIVGFVHAVVADHDDDDDGVVVTFLQLKNKRKM